jgi:hypothetical protein
LPGVYFTPGIIFLRLLPSRSDFSRADAHLRASAKCPFVLLRVCTLVE